MSVSASKVVLGVVSIILLGLGGIFVIASAVSPYRLLIGIPLMIAGLAIAYKLLKEKPKIIEVRVSWDPSGKLLVEELKCPYCGASLPEPKPGQEFIKCEYCGRTIKLVEEPRW